MKKVWLFFLVLVIPIGVFARAKTSCDYTLLSKLKRYASNVNIIYDYKIINDEVYFDITISNVVPQIYISDEILYSCNHYDISYCSTIWT